MIMCYTFLTFCLCLHITQNVAHFIQYDDHDPMEFNDAGTAMDTPYRSSSVLNDDDDDNLTLNTYNDDGYDPRQTLGCPTSHTVNDWHQFLLC